MIILAFLQNMWVKPEKVKEAQAFADRYKGTAIWNNFVKALLFNGCKTGRVLKATFGDELIYDIIFDECTMEIASDSKRVCKPDIMHIQETIERIKPDIIITFGNAAYTALHSLKPCWEIVKLPHPAARQPNTSAILLEAGHRLKGCILIKETSNGYTSHTY